MEEDDQIRPGETLERLCGGRLKILQKKKGYRFSIDALLLARFVRLKKGDRVVDLGAGSGVVGMLLACRFPGCGRVTGIEIQDDLAAMARRSVRMSGIGDRVDILRGDVRDLRPLFEPASFDAAVFNPPYRKAGSGRINPAEERALARHEIRGSAADFLSAAQYLLADGGRVFLIYPARRMAEALFAMRSRKIEPKRLRVVYSKASSGAVFVLLEGRKGGGEELKVEPALFIYREEGGYTEQMQEVFSDLSGS